MKVNVLRFALYIAAMNLIGLGVSYYIIANIGLGSWDVFHKNMADFYGLSVGTWVFIVGFIVILISQVFYFQPKYFLAIITGLITGKLIDFWSYIFNFLTTDDFIIRIPLFLTSILLLGSGISLLVMSKLPPSPPDVLMISLIKKFKLNYLKAKTLTESLLFVIAITVGTINSKPFNNLGIGTFIVLITIGSSVQFFSQVWKKIFGDLL